MTGVHDCGGVSGLPPIDRRESDGPFGSEWEARVFALDAAISALEITSADAMRHAVERMSPDMYVKASYYERWLDGMERLLEECGMIDRTELAIGRATFIPRAGATQVLRVSEVERYIAAPRSYLASSPLPARFRTGESVRVRAQPVGRHTRLPRYAAHKRGLILHDHGTFVFPDCVAHCAGDHPQHLYTIEFQARELWGRHATEADRCLVDLYEDYLEAAPSNDRS